LSKLNWLKHLCTDIHYHAKTITTKYSYYRITRLEVSAKHVTSQLFTCLKLWSTEIWRRYWKTRNKNIPAF